MEKVEVKAFRKTFKNEAGDTIEIVFVPLESKGHTERFLATVTKGDEVIKSKVVYGKDSVERLIRMYKQMSYEDMDFKAFITATRGSDKGIWWTEHNGTIYVSGNTYPVRNELRKRGFKWDGRLKVWKARAEKISIKSLEKTGAKRWRK